MPHTAVVTASVLPENHIRAQSSDCLLDPLCRSAGGVAAAAAELQALRAQLEKLISLGTK